MLERIPSLRAMDICGIKHLSQAQIVASIEKGE